MPRSQKARANAVRPLMTQDEFDRLSPDKRAAAEIASWEARGLVPAEPKTKPSRFTKAEIQRAVDAARAAGFEFDELEVGGIVMRRRAAPTSAAVSGGDVEAELAAYEASRARR